MINAYDFVNDGDSIVSRRIRAALVLAYLPLGVVLSFLFGSIGALIGGIVAYAQDCVYFWSRDVTATFKRFWKAARTGGSV